MNLDEQEEELYLNLAEYWEPQAPPRNFARQVAVSAAHQGSTPRSKRRVLGLLLAAFLVSGAAAASFARGGAVPKLAPDQLPELPLSSVAAIKVLPMVVGSARSEPDRLVESKRASRAPAPRRGVPPEAVPEPKVVVHPLHLPACECGPGGNICGCSN